jgi:F-type H+-transporting ATPase subunit delta
VTNKTAAARYARALFDVALAEKADLDAIEQELVSFADLLTTHEALGKVLLNPAVPAPRKGTAVAALVKSGRISPVLAKLLVLLAERDRLVLLPDLVASYRDRLLDNKKIVRAEVTSAAPLPADRAKAIERTLADVTGRGVRLSMRVDSSLVGGLVAKIGGTVYDGSVTTQLKKMKQRLMERS